MRESLLVAAHRDVNDVVRIGRVKIIDPKYPGPFFPPKVVYLVDFLTQRGEISGHKILKVDRAWTHRPPNFTPDKLRNACRRS
jgi:hypothetical protein